VIHLHQQVLSLGEIAQTSAEPLRAALAAANVQLQVNVEPGPVLVLGDETRLAQCVTNLLSNALKFTPPGGIVNLGVRREGALAVLEVRDTGAGIAPASLERIFQLFVQDQPSGLRGNAGLGIGLALTRKLVELHGGTIRAFSRGPGLGSKFRVELPLAAQAAPARRPPQGPEALAATGASVLVVDDNQDAADSLREMLAMSGYRARSAYTGQGALDAIASEAPDLALLDIGLPDIDGYEVCRRVRAHAHGGRPALIALTGWGQERDKERAIAAGFNGHITKPADPRTLLAMVRQLTTT
jgi:CheY-like chemotaxis protein/two-component sensor histidine kinase